MIVVDTNVVAYMCLEGEWTEAAERLRLQDHHWRAPHLWRSEFRSVLAGQMRRSGLRLSTAMAALERADGMVQSAEVNSRRVLELTAQTRCTAYDLEFVALAQQLAVPLVTMDRELLDAFPDIARPLVS